MKRSTLAMIVLFMAGTILLSGCSASEPSRRDLEEMIPSEVLSYQYGGNQYTSAVASLEIVRSRTYEDVYTADCIIRLTDDVCDRTAYITISSIRWNKGGWQLEEWSPYQQEDMNLKVSFDKRFLADRFSELGYNFNNFTETTFREQDDGTILVTYNVQDEHMNLTAYGEISAVCIMESNGGYPMEYFWDIEADESDISCVWNIFGLWSAKDLPPFYEDYGTVYLLVSDISEERFWTDLRIPYYSFAGKVNRYNRIGELRVEKEYSFNGRDIIGNYYNSISTLLERNLILSVSTSNDIYSPSDVDMQFYADSAYCTYISGLNVGSRKISGWVDLQKVS